MQPIEFANPELFMSYFVTNKSLSIGPDKPLVIKNVESILASGVLNNKLSNSSEIIYAQYFLNRIVLPLGITLHNKSLDHTLQMRVADGVATITTDRETKLRAKNGPILTTIGDLVIRMVQAGRHVFTIPRGERLYIADTDIGDQLNTMPEQPEGHIASLFAPYCFIGGDLTLTQKIAPRLVSRDNIEAIELDLLRDFRLELNRKFEYDSPRKLGKAINALGGFTLPAGKILKVEDVYDRTFLAIQEKDEGVGKWLVPFFDRCLALYGLKTTTLSYGGTVSWSFEDNDSVDRTFTLTMTEELVVTTTKSDEAFVELKSLAHDMFFTAPYERKVTLGAGQRLIFLLTDFPEEKIKRIDRYLPPENIEKDEEGKVLEDYFLDTTGIIGLSWELTGKQVGFSTGIYLPLNIPTLNIETGEELTLELVPSEPAQLIVEIINEGTDKLREAFLEQDPKIFRYILFQIFVRILGGSLSEFSTEDLVVLDLKDDVLGEIARLRSEADFKKNEEIVKENHFAEVEKITDLGFEEFDDISIDTYSPFVQTLLKNTYALIAEEFQGSEILSTHFETAYQDLEKM